MWRSANHHARFFVLFLSTSKTICQTYKIQPISQLTGGYRRIREEIQGCPPPKNRIATSRDRRPLRGGASSASQAPAIPKKEQTVEATIDPMAPSSSDPILLRPGESAYIHGQGPNQVNPFFAHPPWFVANNSFSDRKQTERRSLPPSQVAPGPHNREAVNSWQLAQLMEMVKGLANGLQNLEARLDSLPQAGHTFPFSPLLRHNDDE